MPIAASLYYFAHEANNHSRPPVILIHGAGGSHLSWPPQLRRLHNQRMFALDLPAHGKSQDIGRHSIEDYVHDVLEFMCRDWSLLCDSRGTFNGKRSGAFNGDLFPGTRDRFGFWSEAEGVCALRLHFCALHQIRLPLKMPCE